MRGNSHSQKRAVTHKPSRIVPCPSLSLDSDVLRLHSHGQGRHYICTQGKGYADVDDEDADPEQRCVKYCLIHELL